MDESNRSISESTASQIVTDDSLVSIESSRSNCRRSLINGKTSHQSVESSGSYRKAMEEEREYAMVEEDLLR